MLRANRIGIALVAVAALAWSGSRAAAEGDALTTLKIGMVQGMFRDVQPALVQVMSKPLREIMNRQTGLDGFIEILPDSHALTTKMADKTLQLGVFHGFEFAWIAQKNPDIVPLVVTMPPGGKVQACVVVQKDSTIQKLADLEEETVCVHRSMKSHCLLFLERERNGLPKGTAKVKKDVSKTAEDVLDMVTSGESAAALVDAASLAGYKSIQPGAFKQLRILCESECFPPAVIAFRKGTIDEATVAKVRASLIQAHQNPWGKPLMMMWNLKGFTDVPADYPSQLAAIRKAYPAPAPPK